MAEIKRTFSTGRMNRDLDERLVPNGEYFHAENIQVRTSDGSSAGAVQNIKGNVSIGVAGPSTDISDQTCIGSISNEQTNSSYFLFACTSPSSKSPGNISTKKRYIDTILEVTDNGRSRTIFTDLYAVEHSYVTLGSPTTVGGTNWVELNGLDSSDTKDLRSGMSVIAYNSNGEVLTEPNTIIRKITNTTITVNKKQPIDISGSVTPTERAVSFRFEAKKVLGFNKSKQVTGINIVDNLLFYVSEGEPRKINLSAARVGTNSNEDHTLKTVSKVRQGKTGHVKVEYESDDAIYLATGIKEEDITVIKKAPKLAPALKLFSDKRSGGNTWIVENYSGFITDDFSAQSVGYEGVLPGLEDFTQFSSGDIIDLTSQVDGGDVISVSIKIISITEQGDVNYKIVSINPAIQADNTVWTATSRANAKKIFEYKFPRFAFRYKYDDNEYSSFGPFSEVAFLPGDYTLDRKEGYNLSMVNNLSKIEITNVFGDDFSLDKSVKCIDILYKSTDSPAIYVVKTLERDKDPEFASKSTTITIDTDMINQIVPDDQILRAWDNVPIEAKAQEIVGNRIVYGNYTQGYDIPFKPLLEQSIISTFLTNETSTVEKSIKSIRGYKLGVVFGDKYGRETPVISLGTRDVDKEEGPYIYGSDDVIVDKSLARRANKFQVRQNWTTQIFSSVPPKELEYVKYYIKETSSDYYNLLVDRWYDAGDGNIWLAFPSSERNKLDEDTYLILKKASGSNTAVSGDYKYKVLAISNEAPEFIKTSYGPPISLDATNSSMHWLNPNPPAHHQDTMIQIDASDWVDSIEVLHNGTRKARLVGTFDDTDVGDITLKTPYVNIVRAVEVTGGSQYNVFMSETFGSTAHFAERLVSMGAYSSLAAAGHDYSSNTWQNSGKIKLEIVNAYQNNSPDFEGRFFVKINRDTGLEYNVLQRAISSTEYSVIGTFSTNHIDTANATNPGVDWGAPVGNHNYSWVGGATNVSDPYPQSNLGSSCSDGDLDENWWSTLVSYNYNALGSTAPGEIFLDNARYREGGNVETPGETATEGSQYYQEGTTTKIPGGLSKSQAAELVTDGELFDQITFSYLKFNGPRVLGAGFFQNEVATNLLTGFGKLLDTTTPAIFRFKLDPNQTKYRVTSVVTKTVSNFSQPNSNGCADCANPAAIDTGPDEPNPPGPGNDSVPFRGIRSFDESARIPASGGPDDPTPPLPEISHMCERVRNTVTFERLNDLGFSEGPGIGIDVDAFDPRSVVAHDMFGAITATIFNGHPDHFLNIEILEEDESQTIYQDVITSPNPAVFETEPKDSVDLELYYEASNAIPQRLNLQTTSYFAPIGCKVKRVVKSDGTIFNLASEGIVTKTLDSIVQILLNETDSTGVVTNSVLREIIPNDIIEFEHSNGTITRAQFLSYIHGNVTTKGEETDISSFNVNSVQWSSGSNNQTLITGISDTSNIQLGALVTHADLPERSFVKSINTNTSIVIDKVASASNGNKNITILNNHGFYKLNPDVYKNAVDLGWFNCYSYGNGVESNRIRDDFNAPIIDNGVKVSTTFTGYKKDFVSNGLIYSGIYNANSNTNRLNEFNMAKKITKDLNPEYGSIQALKTRDTDVITFTEDKVLRVLANKDALFNADGNVNLTASDRVLGQAVPYVGDYGISKNPESIAQDQYRIYFTDKQRGAVLRLSRDGLTPISNIGMKTFFRNYFQYTDKAIGSFDTITGEYNLTLKTQTVARRSDVTISFNEVTKGWVSFKSFIQDSGKSVGGCYYTANTNKVWKHNENKLRNNFYGSFSPSKITAILNDLPSTIKTFKTLGYEGTEGRSVNINNQSISDSAETPNNLTGLGDGLFDNLSGEPSDGYGWSAEISTDEQSGFVNDFRDKENKWYGFIIGSQAADNLLKPSSIDVEDFTTQGLGQIESVSNRTAARTLIEFTIKN